MGLVIDSAPVPLQTDQEGVVRVSGTRVTLEAVVTAFKDGATAEEIAQQYPTVALADVYAVISYYLRQRSTVDTYVGERRKAGEDVRQEMESRFDPQGVRDRLQARQAGRRATS